MSILRSLSLAGAAASYGSHPCSWWADLMEKDGVSRADSLRDVEDLKNLRCLISDGPVDGEDWFHADLDRVGRVTTEHALAGEPRVEPDRPRSRVSMIITTNGRSSLLRQTLARLSDLTLPDEIIVVDDGTFDDSVHNAVEWTQRFTNPLPIRYVRNENPGMTNCCHARNVALKMAQHDEILTTEPECWYVSDVVAQLLDARVDHPDQVLSAERCYHAPDTTATLNLDACDVVPAWPYINLWRREWLFDVGGWDEALPGPWGWDDSDLYNRLLAHDPPHGQYFVDGLFVHHMWHRSRIEPAAENEAHVRSKVFPRDVVANQGRDWGELLK